MTAEEQTDLRVPRRLLFILYVALALTHLVPVWRVPYLPTTDGPSHVYNAAVLRELAAGSPAFTRVYEADPRPCPNWVTHALLAGGLSFATPATAEKLVFSVIVLTFLFGAWRLAGLFDRRNAVWAFLVMPLSYHVLLQMGFYNYSLGVALVPFALASWWDGRARRGWRPRTATAVWLLLCYFTHALPAAIALVLVGIGWIVLSRRRPWRDQWPELIAFAPAAALLCWFFVAVPSPGGHWTWAGAFTWQLLFRVGLLFTLDVRQIAFSTALGVAFGVLIVLTFLLENVDWQRRRLRFRERDGALFAAIFAATLHIAAPLSVEEGLVLKMRLLVFPYLLVLPWLSPRLPRALFACVFAAVALGNVLFIRNAWKPNAYAIRSRIAPFAAARSERTFVSLIFDRTAPRSPLPLLAHIASYRATESRLVDLGNYEASLAYFPVKFRPGIRHPSIYDLETAPQDFDPAAWADDVELIYTWKMPPGSPVEERLRARYRVIAEEGEARLWERK